MAITPVITSRAAKEHFNIVKSEHAEVLVKLKTQAERLALLNKEKQMVEKEEAQVNAQNQKEQAAQMHKQQELELKKKALLQQ